MSVLCSIANLDSSPGVSLSSFALHAAEAEGWEALRASQPRAHARNCGSVCAAIVAVHVAVLEKRKQYAEAAELLTLLLEAPFLPRRRGQWWIRLAIDRDHVPPGRQDQDIRTRHRAAHRDRGR